MKPQPSQNMKDILWEVLDVEPHRRSEFLSRSGMTDEIRSEIESLLSFEEASADFMSLPITDFSSDFYPPIPALETSFIGQMVGAYRIVDELGIGGMGAVYLAERSDGKFEQKVAVKLLRRELNVGVIRSKFEQEKEILAKLHHPNIASLLDTGTTTDGLPYLVMEYVEGVPVDKFCEAEHLSLKERLKLFNKVCEAVSFAHRNLIIHRDLKPSNILVSKNGEPKLLDFGISKLLDGNEETRNTALGAMTPQYAAPEQIQGEGVSTATDIYSLGVILYRIVTGELPFHTKGKTNGELLKAITEAEPTAPSMISDAQARIFNDENSSPSGNFRPQLKGDLDNIVLKALSKEPERRYETVEQFSGDIWRHLDGLPVLARPATVGYRASKFYKRNRVSVVAGMLILLSLVGGIVAATWQAREARAQARLSAIETENAKEEQRKSEKVTKYVSKIVGYANPAWFAEGAKTKGKARVIDVVEELSTKIDEEFSDEPDVAATLHGTFSEIFHWVARSAPPEQSEKYWEQRNAHALRSLELRRQYYGEHHELVALALAGTYYVRGKNDAERAGFLMEAMQMMRETNPNNINYPYMFETYVARMMHPDIEVSHDAYRNAVVPATNENKYQIAERMLREALTLWRLHYPPDHGVIRAKTCWLAYTLVMQEKWAEFDEPYQVCKQIRSEQGTEGLVVDKDLALVEKALADKGR